MNGLELRNSLRPVIRSWPWVLIFGGGLLLEGVITLLSTVWMAVMINTHNMASFRAMIAFPVGVFSILSGWHFIRCARVLSAACEPGGPFSIRDYADRMRLALLFGGCAAVFTLFMVVSSLFFRMQP